jgi:hypothetical protein
MEYTREEEWIKESNPTQNSSEKYFSSPVTSKESSGSEKGQTGSEATTVIASMTISANVNHIPQSKPVTKFNWYLGASRLKQDYNIISNWDMHTGPNLQYFSPVLESIYYMWHHNVLRATFQRSSDLYENIKKKVLCVMIKYEKLIKQEQIYVHVIRKFLKAYKTSFLGCQSRSNKLRFIKFFSKFYDTEYQRVKEIIVIHNKKRTSTVQDRPTKKKFYLKSLQSEFRQKGIYMFVGNTYKEQSNYDDPEIKNKLSSHKDSSSQETEIKSTQKRKLYKLKARYQPRKKKCIYPIKPISLF